jgi:DNA-binding LytR/AlgR family response regulator
MTILILEDEAIIARRLSRLVRDTCPYPIRHIEIAPTLAEARTVLADTHIDVLFLDLNLNGADGFDLLEATAADPYHTVVVSAHTERAMEAFELGVIDFVGKPFGAARLETTFSRLLDTRHPPVTPATALVVRKSGRLVRIPVDELLRVEGAGTYARLVCRDGRTELHSKSLKQLTDILPPRFIRVHRSHIVDLTQIESLRSHEGSRYDAVLQTGETIPVGRTRVDDLRERMSSG